MDFITVFIFLFLELYKITVADKLNFMLVKCLVDIGILHYEVLPVASFPSARDRFHLVGRESRVYVGFAEAVGNGGEVVDEVLFKLFIRVAALDAFGEDQIVRHNDIVDLAEHSRKNAGRLEKPHRCSLGTLRFKRF